MPRGKPLSAAHKAAISAALKRYHAGRGSSGGSKRRSGIGVPMQATSPAPKLPGKKSPAVRQIQNIDTGKAISREEAARRMFGPAGAAKKIAAGKKRKGSVKR